MELSLFGNLGGFPEDICLTRLWLVNEVVFEARADVVVLDTPDFGARGHDGALVGFDGCAACNLDGPDFCRESEVVEYVLCVFVRSVSAHD